MVRVWMGVMGAKTLKISCPSRKNGRRLGIEEREALVHVDLRQVGLDLREVGVDRKVGGQVGRDAVLQVEPRLGHAVVDERPARVECSDAEGRVTVGRISRLRLVDRSVSPSSTPICARNWAMFLETGDQTTVSSFPWIDRLTWNPQRCDSPRVHRRVAQALERNRQLRRPAVFRRRPGRDEERIPGDVAFRNAAGRRLRGSALRAEGPPLAAVAQAGRVQNRVPLHAEAVDGELIRPLPVAERVEEERDGVVLRDSDRGRRGSPASGRDRRSALECRRRGSRRRRRHTPGSLRWPPPPRPAPSARKRKAARPAARRRRPAGRRWPAARRPAPRTRPVAPRRAPRNPPEAAPPHRSQHRQAVPATCCARTERRRAAGAHPS